jgi:hypothetical protein
MTNIFNEEWRPVPGYEGLYSVSNLGNIRSEDRIVFYPKGTKRIAKGKIKKQTPGHQGKYWRVTMTCSEGVHKNRSVHQVVCWAFIGPQTKGVEVRHKNGNGHDNRLENLCYGTKVDNMQDAIKHGTFQMGESHSDARFSTKDVVHWVMSDKSAKELALEYGTSDVYIQAIRRGRTRARETEGARRIKVRLKHPSKFDLLSDYHLRIIKDFSIKQRDAALIIGVPQRTIWRWRNYPAITAQ